MPHPGMDLSPIKADSSLQPSWGVILLCESRLKTLPESPSFTTLANFSTEHLASSSLAHPGHSEEVLQSPESLSTSQEGPRKGQDFAQGFKAAKQENSLIRNKAEYIDFS